MALRKTLEGLNLYKSLSDKFDMHMNNANIQASEAVGLLNLYQSMEDHTILKAVQFHRDIARAEEDEADKYFDAAEEVVNRFNLDESIKQAGLKRLKRGRSNRIHAGKRSARHATHGGSRRFSKKRYGIK